MLSVQEKARETNLFLKSKIEQEKEKTAMAKLDLKEAKRKFRDFRYRHPEDGLSKDLHHYQFNHYSHDYSTPHHHQNNHYNHEYSPPRP